jgi:hypothetical protein
MLLCLAKSFSICQETLCVVISPSKNEYIRQALEAVNQAGLEFSPAGD